MFDNIGTVRCNVSPCRRNFIARFGAPRPARERAPWQPAERADRRRRLRLDLLRQHLTSNVGFPPRRPPRRRLGPAVRAGVCRVHGRLPRDAVPPRRGGRQARGRDAGRRSCSWRSAGTGAASSIRCPISTSWSSTTATWARTLSASPRVFSTRSGTSGFRSATRSGACRTVSPWRGRTFRAARRCSRRGSSWGTGGSSIASARCSPRTSTRRTSPSSSRRRSPSATSATASSAARRTWASPTSRSRRAACATSTRRCGSPRPSSARARCASCSTSGSSRSGSRRPPTRR